jgi:glutaredoxin
MAKEWLTAKSVPFTDYNVGEDLAKRKEMVEMTGQLGVPVIRIGDEVQPPFRTQILINEDDMPVPLLAECERFLG